MNLTDERKEKLIGTAFEHYRKTGFPYPRINPYDLWSQFFTLQDIELKISEPQGTLPGFDSVKTIESRFEGISLANHFHPHIWESHASGMRSPIDAFQDDKALRKAIRLALETTGKVTDTSVRNKLKIVNGTQMCSNFRPTVAKAIYSCYLPPGGVTLDPSAGYGGRLLGFLAAANGAAEYIGVDPSSATHAGNYKLANFFGKSISLLNSPFEDVQPSSLPDDVDLVFTSPPYFKKEIYSAEKTQSCHRYPRYQEWLTAFWQETIQRASAKLHRSGHFVINIQDVRIRQHVYPLINDTIKIAETASLSLIDTLEMHFSGFGKNLKKWKTEKVLVFRKD